MSPIGIEYQPPSQKGNPDQSGKSGKILAYIKDPAEGETTEHTIPIANAKRDLERGTFESVKVKVEHHTDGIFIIQIDPRFKDILGEKHSIWNPASRGLPPKDGFRVDITEGISATYIKEIPPGTPPDKIF